MVSVHAIGPNVCGLKPGRGDEFLTAIKIRSTPSFGREVNPEALCRKFLRHVKNHLQVWTKILCHAKYIILSVRSSCFLPDYCW
jgi:hypothetical protein